jgi:hypothetical protein
MALPQLQSTAEGRQFLDLMKDQKENIVSQTKIMQSMSVSIIRQGREATELRKEIANLRKGFVTGKSSNFEDIKKYFSSNKKDVPAEKEKASDKGFFKNALGKIFGPSAYQQKMLDDTKIIRMLTETQTEDIAFIKKSYEEETKKKDRELLAEAIASKINMSSSEGGMGELFAGLLAGIVAGLATLGRGIVSSLVTAMEQIVSKIGQMASALGRAIGGIPGGGGMGPMLGNLGGALMAIRHPAAMAIGAAISAAVAMTPSEETEAQKAAKAYQKDYGSNYDELIKDSKNKVTTEQYKSLESSMSEKDKAAIESAGPPGSIEQIKAMREYVDTHNKVFSDDKKLLEQMKDIENNVLSQQHAKYNLEAGKTSTGEDYDYLNYVDQKKKIDKAVTESASIFDSMTEGAATLGNKIKEFFTELDPTPLMDQGKDFLNNFAKITLSNGQEMNLLPGFGDSLATVLEGAKGDLESAKDFLENQGSGSVNVNTVNQTSMTSGGQSSINYQSANSNNDSEVWKEYLRSRGIN